MVLFLSEKVACVYCISLWRWTTSVEKHSQWHLTNNHLIIKNAELKPKLYMSTKYPSRTQIKVSGLYLLYNGTYYFNLCTFFLFCTYMVCSCVWSFIFCVLFFTATQPVALWKQIKWLIDCFIDWLGLRTVFGVETAIRRRKYLTLKVQY